MIGLARRKRWAAAAAIAAAALAAVLSVQSSARAADGGALPPVGHVFVVMLENENAPITFGPSSPAPYLAQTLTSRGAFIPNYYGVTHYSLGNYLGLISGQGSNADTQDDCSVFTDFSGSTFDLNGQILGHGCVYPASVQTIAGQLTGRGLTWKAYLEDMGNDPARAAATCGHPAIGAVDPTGSAEIGDGYAVRHNPFVYFHSITDSPQCAANDVALSRLPADLGSASTTANLSVIVPNLCHDGHDAPCVNGEPGGLASVDAWLQQWVPVITASEAYKQDGLLLITFDEADDDATACCNQAQFPNVTNNGGPWPGRGGGRTGAVALSPYIKAGTLTQTPYNHFSTLRTAESLFGLPFLGYAASPDPGTFGADIFNAPVPGTPRVVPLRSRGPVVMAWSPPPGMNVWTTRYTLQHKRATAAAYTTIASGLVLPVFVIPRELEGTWTYRVIASNGSITTGASAPSDAVVVDWPPGPPSFR